MHLQRPLGLQIIPGAQWLDVDGAELLQALWMCMRLCQRLYMCWATGIWYGAVVFLAPAGAACACDTILAGEGGALRWVILQPRIQVALLVILLIHKLMVLQTKTLETK